ncbi:hypothetical protein PAL_GLEAN10022709 [Pteropus alecto]|uniref:Uncharacterized protein n=1 Tax=Pteropus alecto TaxID=9402 RepID=L5K566_PTEAL|nr:hypothetical protein PAL_GLEAN10022709 [Pteropus alecto]
MVVQGCEPDRGSGGVGGAAVPAAATCKCSIPATLVLLCHVAVSFGLISETSSRPSPPAAPTSHTSCKGRRERCLVVVKKPDIFFTWTKRRADVETPHGFEHGLEAEKVVPSRWHNSVMAWTFANHSLTLHTDTCSFGFLIRKSPLRESRKPLQRHCAPRAPEVAWFILVVHSLRQDALHLLRHVILSSTALDVRSSVLREVLKGLGKKLAKLPPVAFEGSWRLGRCWKAGRRTKSIWVRMMLPTEDSRYMI